MTRFFQLLAKGVTIMVRALTTRNYIRRVPLEEDDIPGEPLPDYSLPDALKDNDDSHR